MRVSLNIHDGEVEAAVHRFFQLILCNAMSAEFDQSESFAIRIENRAGAVLGVEAGDAIIMQGVAHGGVDRDGMRDHNGVALNLQKCLNDLVAPAAEGFVHLRPAARPGVFQPGGVVGEGGVRQRGKFAEAPVGFRSDVPETREGSGSFKSTARSAGEDG